MKDMIAYAATFIIMMQKYKHNTLFFKYKEAQIEPLFLAECSHFFFLFLA